jgi:hypothetical protein
MDTPIVSVLRFRVIAAQTESVIISLSHAAIISLPANCPVYNFGEMGKRNMRETFKDFDAALAKAFPPLALPK